MADKTALNTGWTYYSNVVFACGFTDSTGDFTELVSATQIGVLGGTSTSRGTDGTHGEFVSLESDDSRVNFGDNVNWDGTSQITVAVLAQNDATSIPGGAADTQYIFSKEGSGADSYACAWLNSENLYGQANAANVSITDGLDDGTSGAVATNWNNIGITCDGTNLTTRVNAFTAQTAFTDSINATAHDLVLGNNDSAVLDRGWLGNVAGFIILDTGLSNSDWATLTSDWTGTVFAAAGGATPKNRVNYGVFSGPFNGPF